MDSVRADLSESNMVFIHSALDDAGLSAPAFRVFCHLSRRAGKEGKYPGAESMAEVCRLDRKTVFRALKELEERGMMTRTARPGCSTKYTLQSPSRWGAKRDDPKGTTGGETGRGVGCQTGQGVSQTAPHEGYPYKDIQEGNPKRASAAAPEGSKNVPRKSAPRSPDEAFEVLAGIQGSNLSSLTKSERGRINRALAEIRTACPSVTAEQIRRRADAYREEMPKAALTAVALAAHWSRLAGSEPVGNEEKKFRGAARLFDAAEVGAPPAGWEDAFELLHDMPADGEWHHQQPYVRDEITRFLEAATV